MGCSLARPTNNPIIISASNQVHDNNVLKLDQRVLCEKFSPIKTIAQGIQIEAIEAPDILAFDPRNGVKKEFEVSGIPQYSTENLTLSGKWVYIENFVSEHKENAFVRETQHLIEKEFIKRSLRCPIELYGKYAEIIFKDMTVVGNKENDGKKEHFSYPVKRTSLRREAYGWNADDGVVRPIAREIEDILNFTTGVYTFKLDNHIFTIDLKKKVLIDTETAFARPFLNL